MFEKLPPEISGAVMAIVMSVLRILYDSKSKAKPFRIVLESLICGALTLTAGSAIQALGADSRWIFFVGGVIGYFGPVTVRAVALKYFNSRAEDGKF